MPFGIKDLDPRPQLTCQACHHKERASPTHAAAALKAHGHVKCGKCGGLMWMPGSGPFSRSAEDAPAEDVPLETAFVRRGEMGFGIVLDDSGTVVGGPGHTNEAIPFGATVVCVNGTDVNSKAEIIACIKDVAVSGQAEFTYRPIATESAAQSELSHDDEADAAAAATASKLKKLDDAFAIGALTEEQYMEAKLRLIEPPSVGVEPSPRTAPPVLADLEPQKAQPGVEPESQASADERAPVVTEAQSQANPDDELTPRTEAEIASKYLGKDHASEAAAVLSAAKPEPEPEPEPDDDLTPQTEAEIANKYLGEDHASEAAAVLSIAETEPEPEPVARMSSAGILGGLASIDLDPRPVLACANPSCGNRERVKVTDGVTAVGALMKSSSHHVKCSKCGSVMWMPGIGRVNSQASPANIEAWTREFEASVPQGWDELTKTASKHSRSTLIRLRNRATTVLTLGPETAVVESGMWIAHCEPPAVVQPGEEVVFGVGSRGRIGAAEGKLVYILQPPDGIDPHTQPWEQVELMIHWTNPVMSVPNVNERRCVGRTTPLEGGCGIIHIGKVSDDHNNVVCITVAEPTQPEPAIPATAVSSLPSAPTASVPAVAGDLTAAHATDPLAGLTLVELSERAGLDAELLEGMLEAMDGDEAAVEFMLREQIAADPQLPLDPPDSAGHEPELSEGDLAERYLSSPGQRRDQPRQRADETAAGEEMVPKMSAEEQRKQLLAEAEEAQAAREAARAEFEEEMAGAAKKVKKRQEDEAAAVSAAAQVKEAQQILQDNAQKLGEMSDTTNEMQHNAQDFAAGIAALNSKKKSGGFLGGLLS